MLRAEPCQTEFLGISPQRPRAEFLAAQTTILRVASVNSQSSGQDDDDDEDSLDALLSGLDMDAGMPAALYRHTSAQNDAPDHRSPNQLFSGFGRVQSNGSDGVFSRAQSSDFPTASPVGNFMKRSAPVDTSQPSSPLIQVRNFSSVQARQSPQLGASQPSNRPTRMASPLLMSQGRCSDFLCVSRNRIEELS